MVEDTVQTQIQGLYRALLAGLKMQPRWGQKQMIAAFARHLLSIRQDGDGKRLGTNPACAIEAGTGTGKTLAYIVAALPVAKALEKKVVISTATIALQEQIIEHDLPNVSRHGDWAFEYRLAKGRRRYVCVSRLDSALSNNQALDPTQGLFEDELAAKLDDIQVTLYQSMVRDLGAGKWDGDRDAWEEPIDEDLWRPVTTDHRGCTNRRCNYFSDCPFFKARAGIEQADCIVTNHDLVLADLQLGGGVVLPAPEDTIYIFDEGHHLADKTLNQFTNKVGLRQLQRWYGQVNTATKRFAKEWQDGGRGMQLSLSIQEKIPTIEQWLITMEELVDQPAFAPQDTYQQPSSFRFPHGVVPDEIRAQASQLALVSGQLGRLVDGLYELVDGVIKGEQMGLERDHAEVYLSVFGGWAQACMSHTQLWQTYASLDEDGSVPTARWLQHWQTSERNDIELASSPILANTLLQQNLWQRCYSALITSATLMAVGRFDQLLLHTGLGNETTTLALASPFDHGNSVLAIPKEAVEPGNEDAFVAALVDALKKHLKEDEASLVLFTSRRVMHGVFDMMPSRWQDLILQQGESSKQRLLMQHRQRIDDGEGSVLFGLASFAEGIDLPGEYLTHLVITRLPFTVPDRPVPAALAEWVEANGGNAFMDISVPEASVRLIQATGRLLRKESDVGRITVLDKRLVTKRYGKQLLHTLPPYQQEFFSG